MTSYKEIGNEIRAEIDPHKFGVTILGDYICMLPDWQSTRASYGPNDDISNLDGILNNRT